MNELSENYKVTVLRISRCSIMRFDIFRRLERHVRPRCSANRRKKTYYGKRRVFVDTAEKGL